MQRVSVYSGFTAKLKSGPRRQFGPRRSPERFWCFHRVIGPIQLYGNTDFHLGRSWVKTGYVAHGHFCCIHRYTRTRVASRPSRAIQLYSAIHYTAIHRYTLYNLYNTPLGDCWPHVEKFHLRHAPASIEVIRKGGKCSVTGEELCDSDFENMVWTKIPDVGTA